MIRKERCRLRLGQRHSEEESTRSLSTSRQRYKRWTPSLFELWGAGCLPFTGLLFSPGQKTGFPASITDGRDRARPRWEDKRAGGWGCKKGQPHCLTTRRTRLKKGHHLRGPLRSQRTSRYLRRETPAPPRRAAAAPLPQVVGGYVLGGKKKKPRERARDAARRREINWSSRG